MQFQPKTDEEIQRMMLIPDGAKCFSEVMEAENHTSKESGKESIMLKLAIWEDTSIRTYLFVYLTPAFMLLFKHGCIALLGVQKYKSGNIQAEDFIGKSCNVIIGIEKDKTGKYLDKNKVKDFCIEEVKKPAPQSNQNDESLPF